MNNDETLRIAQKYYSQGEFLKLIKYWEGCCHDISINLENKNDVIIYQLIARSYFECHRYTECLKYLDLLKNKFSTTSALLEYKDRKGITFDLDFLMYFHILHNRKMYFKEYIELSRYKKIGGDDINILNSINQIEEGIFKKKINSFYDIFPFIAVIIVSVVKYFEIHPGLFYSVFLAICFILIILAIFSRKYLTYWTLRFLRIVIFKTVG